VAQLADTEKSAELCFKKLGRDSPVPYRSGEISPTCLKARWAERWPSGLKTYYVFNGWKNGVTDFHSRRAHRTMAPVLKTGVWFVVLGDNMKMLDLNGEWELQYCNIGEGKAGAFSEDSSGWISATVPGDVHLDLMAAGKMEEPLYGLNAKKCEWVEEKEFWYRKIFYVSKDDLSADRIELCFDGLDTTAEIWLNGKKAGASNNMLAPCAFDAKGFLNDGKNILLVRLDCGLEAAKGKPLEKYLLPDDIPSRRIWIRKPQFTFGWDWAPRLLTCGIWRPARINFYKEFVLRNVYLRAKLAGKKAVVKAECEIENLGCEPVSAEIKAALKKKKTYSVNIRANLKPGMNRISVPVQVADPQLWYPRPVGGQPLYDFSLEVRTDAGEIDRYQTAYGIREVKLLQQPLGKEGKSWTFVVNGVKVFCKGADWIPPDSILARAGEEKYRRSVELAAEANFNMLRIWGGGIYEPDCFYRACDEMGVMVWQEFIFACALYPDDDPDFCAEVKQEAELAVKSLRNHPSLVLWCGNNENDWGWATGWWTKADRYYGLKLYSEILPQVCGRFDPDRPYWQSSPFGGADPNSHLEGDRHTWWVSIQGGINEEKFDYRNYARDESKFTSEYGILAPSPIETLKKCIPENELNPSSESWKFHANTFDNTVKGTYQMGMLRYNYDDEPQNLPLEEFTMGLQLIQGEAYKFSIEHYRRRKFFCSGDLFWMYADCWGAASGWTIVDYYLQRKPSFFFVKKAYAPVLVSIKEEEFGLSVWVTNDLLQDFSGTLEFGQKDFFGKEFLKKKIRVKVKANSSKCVVRAARTGEIDMLACYNIQRFFYARLKAGARTVCENRHFFSLLKWLKTSLPKAKLEHAVKGNKLVVKTDNFAWAVKVDLPEGLVPEDNYFDVFPGETKEILLRGDLNLADQVKVKAMNQAES